MNRNKRYLCGLIALFVIAITPAFSFASVTEKPNILVIWGDDIGYWNVSHNNRGMMGYIADGLADAYAVTDSECATVGHGVTGDDVGDHRGGSK